MKAPNLWTYPSACRSLFPGRLVEMTPDAAANRSQKIAHDLRAVSENPNQSDRAIVSAFLDRAALRHRASHRREVAQAPPSWRKRPRDHSGRRATVDTKVSSCLAAAPDVTQCQAQGSLTTACRWVRNPTSPARCEIIRRRPQSKACLVRCRAWSHTPRPPALTIHDPSTVRPPTQA